MTQSIAPKISIVIPVHNCKATIAKCLDSLSRLDHPSFEVTIVDDGSTDSTPEICESFAGVNVIRLEKGGPSRARNRGIKSARGEFVAFTDGDCLVDKRWLQELEKGFTGPLIAGVGGDQKSPEDDTEVGKRIQRFLKTIGFVTGYIKTDAAMKETEHNPSCNSMYRKGVLKQVGCFDEALWPGEDVELDLKITTLGQSLIYNPRAVVFHYRPKNYADFSRMMLRYGACQWYLVRKYGFFRRIQYSSGDCGPWVGIPDCGPSVGAYYLADSSLAAASSVRLVLYQDPQYQNRLPIHISNGDYRDKLALGILHRLGTVSTASEREPRIMPVLCHRTRKHRSFEQQANIGHERRSTMLKGFS